MLAVGVMPPAEAGMGVSVYPSRFRLQKGAGETASGKVRIDNEGTYPVQIVVEVTDMISRVNEEGILLRDEAPPGTSPYSCARWIRVVSGEGAVIPAGQSSEVEFVVSPPPSVTSGGYSAYLFLRGQPAEGFDERDADRPQVRLVTIPRMGVSVIYEVEGTVERTGELTSLEFQPPADGKPMRVLYGFRNTGNAEVVVAASYHILDGQGRMAGNGALRTMKSFPGDAGKAETTLTDALAPGKYTMLITFELGPDSTEAIVRELEFEVPAGG
ncbi:MAG: hypothetical protein COV76_05260 [Candidatus Omnitrophica bacterium CG11_big_fil_rev_8_21_14_0_20_64_10]|nr:MAG: hypothetical protein COV76_05260 [Candidatus Omnitrophica bacterium CG11_big_fil_rev_8_21_14_0_20_64_10]